MKKESRINPPQWGKNNMLLKFQNLSLAPAEFYIISAPMRVLL